MIDVSTVISQGQFYCLECARHFNDQHALDEHRISKVHKRRLKDLAQKKYTQEEAEFAAGKTKEVLPPAHPRLEVWTRPTTRTLIYSRKLHFHASLYNWPRRPNTSFCMSWFTAAQLSKMLMMSKRGAFTVISSFPLKYIEGLGLLQIILPHQYGSFVLWTCGNKKINYKSSKIHYSPAKS